MNKVTNTRWLRSEAELKQRLHCWLRFRYGKNTTDTFAKLIELANEAAKLDSELPVFLF